MYVGKESHVVVVHQELGVRQVEQDVVDGGTSNPLQPG